MNETPFTKLKERLLIIFEDFKKDNIYNVLYAVKYCDEFGLTQQGFTLFIEYIISKVISDCEILTDKEDLYDIELRSVVSSALSLSSVEKFDFDRFDFEKKEKYFLIVNKIFELSYKKKLTKQVYSSLALGGRNDLNHAGFRPISEAKKTGHFKNKLKEYIIRYEKLQIQ